MNNSSLKQISLIQELDLGVEAVKSGLSLIQAIQPHRTPVFLIFLVLSTGLERMLKIVLGMRLLSDERRFLTEKELRYTYGHDLQKLKSKILSVCFDRDNLTPPIRKDDYYFISADALLNELLTQLTEFAKRDRYVYMNGIIDQESMGKWLGERWSDIEKTILPTEEAIQLIENKKDDECKNIISSKLVICIERFVGALARSITLGNMNKDANSAGTLLYDFLLIQESDYGTKKYPLYGHTPV